MLQALRSRIRHDREDGFTLIELMVVVLIIAILVAIAIPTFLGARERAQDKAAQSDLRNALTAAKTHYVEGETYVATAAELEDIEPSLAYDAAVANATSSVVGFTGTADVMLMVVQSDSDTWFCIKDDVTAGTFYGSGSALTAVDTAAECTGASW